MNQTRHFHLILCCFLFLVTNISFGAKDGIRTAVVNSIEAIIYSDPSLNNPIGKISRSNIISIGRPVVKNPKVVPIIVSGRVAYIKLADLFLDSENKIIIDGKENKSGFHDPNLMFQKPPENILENNTAYVTIHQFSAGSQLQNMFLNIDGVNSSNMTGVGVAYLHHQSMTNYIWGIGFEYFNKSSPSASYSFFLFKPTFGFTPFKRSLLDLDVYASLDFSTGANFTISNNAYIERGGFLYGSEIGARAIFLPNLKYHVTTSLAYRIYYAGGSTDYYDAQNTAYPAITKLNGIDFSLGFSIDL